MNAVPRAVLEGIEPAGNVPEYDRHVRRLGSASVGEGALGLLGGNHRDGQAERFHAMGEVAAQPVRDARRQCGDDDLVEPASLERLLHGGEGVIVADHPFDVTARGLVEKRNGEFERGRGLSVSGSQ